MDNQPVLSVVIPVYQEGANLGRLMERMQNTLESTKQSYEIILVDDGSTDSTWTVIEHDLKKYPFIKAIRFSRNFGKESAIYAGLEQARGSAVIIIDGDLQHPPELIPQMVHLWREDRGDVVEAVKTSRGHESFCRRTGARLFYFILGKLTGYDIVNASDFKLLDRKIVNALLKMGEVNLFFRGITAWVGFKHIKLPFQVPERTSGRSGWSVLHLTRLALTAVTSFSVLPLHFVTVTGVMFFLFSLGLGVQTLYVKMTGSAVSGFTTVILLLLLIGSLLMISLGIIGEYIARIYEEVKKRPRFLVAQTIDHVTVEVQGNKDPK